MPLISQFERQSSVINDDDTFIVDRSGLPYKITGENYKTEMSSLLNKETTYCFYGLIGDFRTSETKHEFYLFGKALLENLGYEINHQGLSRGFPIYTLIDSGSGYVKSEKAWIYHYNNPLEDTVPRIFVSSSSALQTYEKYDSTAIDIKIKTYYGKFPGSDYWIHYLDLPTNLIHIYESSDLRNVLRYTVVSSIENEFYGYSLFSNEKFVDSTGWTTEASWTIANGKASYDGVNDHTISQAVSGGLKEKRIYKIVFRIETTGSMTLSFLDNLSNVLIASDSYSTGKHTLYFEAQADATDLSMKAFSTGDSGDLLEWYPYPIFCGDLFGTSYISSFHDRKGTEDFVQTTEADQPEFIKILDSIESLSFDGSTELEIVSPVTLSTGTLIFIVEPTNNDGIIFGNSGSANNFIKINQSTETIIINDSTGTEFGSSGNATNLFDDLFHVLSISIDDSGNGKIYIDTTEVDSFTGFTSLDGLNNIGMKDFVGNLMSLYIGDSDTEEVEIVRLCETVGEQVRMILGYSEDSLLGFSEDEFLGFGI